MGGGGTRRRRRQRARPVAARPTRRDRRRVHARPGSTTIRPRGSRIGSGSTRSGTFYSGIGGTTPQLLVQNLAEQILRSELDVALVVGAEALATQRQFKRRGERYPYSFKPEEKRSVPLGGAVPPRGGGARGVPGLAHVRGLRQRAPCPSRYPARRVPDRSSASSGSASRGGRSQPAGVVPDRALGRGDHHRGPDQPDGRLPVHEVHGLDHGRRHGGRARVDESRGRGRDGGADRSARVPARLVLRDRPGLRGRARRPLALAGDGGGVEAALAGAGVGHRRRRTPRSVFVLQLVGELRP